MMEKLQKEKLQKKAVHSKQGIQNLEELKNIKRQSRQVTRKSRIATKNRERDQKHKRRWNARLYQKHPNQHPETGPNRIHRRHFPCAGIDKQYAKTM